MNQPVHFWAVALPLEEVFKGIEEQTDVVLSFFPHEDENRRVRLNLFLSPQRPPSLRELMRQLTWVLDSPFAYTAGESEEREPVYYLLGSAVGQDVAASLEVDQRQLQQRQQTREADQRARVAAKLEEYGRALALSREEVICRYHGVDDFLVLNMLDPAHRAATRLVCSLPDEAVARVLRGERVGREPSDLTPEQQECLAGLLEIGTRALVDAPEEAGEKLLRELESNVRRGGPVQVSGAKDGFIRVYTMLGDGAIATSVGVRTAVADATPMLPAEICALWRQLGIDVTSEMERAVKERYRDSRARQRQHALWRTLSEGYTLSPGAEDLLSSITVPWDGHSHHPLWQVQEAVARTSGVNVISDCFVQPPRDPTRRLSILDSSYAAKRALGLWRFRHWRERHESELHQLTASGAYDEAYRELVSIPTTITALNWLMILCHPQEARTDLLSSTSAAYRRDCSGSEWGDAGSFLRFRSLNRDVWRASMLPPHALKAFDEKLGRFTENVGGTTQPLPSASISFLPEDAAWLIAQLDDLQLLHGGTLAYEDVSTPGGRQRQYLRRELLERVVQGRAMLRLLAALDDAQWDQLRTQGLRLPADLTPEQRAMPALREKIDAMGMTRAREAGELALEYVPAGSGWHVNPELTGIRIRRRDEDMGTWDVSCSLSRQPDNLTPLRVTEEVAPSSFQPSSLERSAN